MNGLMARRMYSALSQKDLVKRYISAVHFELVLSLFTSILLPPFISFPLPHYKKANTYVAAFDSYKN